MLWRPISRIGLVLARPFRLALLTGSTTLDLSCISNDVSVLSTRGIRDVDKVVITRGNLFKKKNKKKGYTDVSTRARMCV
jgi:hypothetical protein